MISIASVSRKTSKVSFNILVEKQQAETFYRVRFEWPVGSALRSAATPSAENNVRVLFKCSTSRKETLKFSFLFSFFYNFHESLRMNLWNLNANQRHKVQSNCKEYIYNLKYIWEKLVWNFEPTVSCEFFSKVLLYFLLKTKEKTLTKTYKVRNWNLLFQLKLSVTGIENRQLKLL